MKSRNVAPPAAVGKLRSANTGDARVRCPYPARPGWRIPPTVRQVSWADPPDRSKRRCHRGSPSRSRRLRQGRAPGRRDHRGIRERSPGSRSPGTGRDGWSFRTVASFDDLLHVDDVPVVGAEVTLVPRLSDDTDDDAVALVDDVAERQERAFAGEDRGSPECRDAQGETAHPCRPSAQPFGTGQPQSDAWRSAGGISFADLSAWVAPCGRPAPVCRDGAIVGSVDSGGCR